MAWQDRVLASVPEVVTAAGKLGRGKDDARATVVEHFHGSFHAGLAPHDVATAVAVQQMVDARAAGSVSSPDQRAMRCAWRGWAVSVKWCRASAVATIGVSPWP